MSKSPFVPYIFPDTSCSWMIHVCNPWGSQNWKKMVILFHFLSHCEPLGASKGPLGIPIIRYLFVLLPTLDSHKSWISVTLGYVTLQKKRALFSFYHHCTFFKAPRVLEGGPCRSQSSVTHLLPFPYTRCWSLMGQCRTQENWKKKAPFPDLRYVKSPSGPYRRAPMGPKSPLFISTSPSTLYANDW